MTKNKGIQKFNSRFRWPTQFSFQKPFSLTWFWPLLEIENSNNTPRYFTDVLVWMVLFRTLIDCFWGNLSWCLRQKTKNSVGFFRNYFNFVDQSILRPHLLRFLEFSTLFADCDHNIEKPCRLHLVKAHIWMPLSVWYRLCINWTMAVLKQSPEEHLYKKKCHKFSTLFTIVFCNRSWVKLLIGRIAFSLNPRYLHLEYRTS